jgi:hypothetical protein
MAAEQVQSRPEARLATLAGKVQGPPDFSDGWGKGLMFRGALLPPDVIAVQLFRSRRTRGAVASTAEDRILGAWLVQRDIGKTAEYVHTSYNDAKSVIETVLGRMKDKDLGGAWCEAEERVAAANDADSHASC